VCASTAYGRLPRTRSTSSVVSEVVSRRCFFVSCITNPTVNRAKRRQIDVRRHWEESFGSVSLFSRNGVMHTRGLCFSSSSHKAAVRRRWQPACRLLFATLLFLCREGRQRTSFDRLESEPSNNFSRKARGPNTRSRKNPRCEVRLHGVE